MVNCIKKIKIENIKGKGNLELEFTNLTANQPNIVVAQNGYGKSTIAKAFKLATKGKINMKKQESSKIGNRVSWRKIWYV